MHLSGWCYNVVIIGGGPAGLAPLLAAHRIGQLDTLLAGGVAVVEQSAHLGAGSIGQHDINSDSSGRTFVDCLHNNAGTPTALTRLADHPLARILASAEHGAVPLQDVGRFLRLVGDTVGRMVQSHPASEVFTRHRALSATQDLDGWRVQVLNLATGETQTLFSRSVVIATGGHQPPERLMTEKVAGIDLIEHAADRLLQSSEVLETGGLQRVAKRLANKASPRVVILGGSTSAASVAHALLHRLPSIRFGTAGVTLIHRRPLRIYYPDRASALADNYTEWTEDDVCPISGRVYRFAGFRLDARELMMQARGIGGRAPEPRFRLHRVGDNNADAMQMIDDADLVIAALGYRPRALPIYDRNGSAMMLLAQTGPRMAMVDGQCRVLDADGSPIIGLYGIGLAAGFVPRGPLGGEPSFRGQANGLWLWQHDIGALIVQAVAGSHPARATTPQQDFSVRSVPTSCSARTLFS